MKSCPLLAHQSCLLPISRIQELAESHQVIIYSRRPQQLMTYPYTIYQTNTHTSQCIYKGMYALCQRFPIHSRHVNTNPFLPNSQSVVHLTQSLHASPQISPYLPFRYSLQHHHSPETLDSCLKNSVTTISSNLGLQQNVHPKHFP